MGVLNFSADNLVTGINIIEGNLYWTDDLNEPKKIEIERFKADDVVLNGGATQIDGRLFDYTDITVIRPHPSRVINLDLEEYTPTDNLPEPPFENIYPRFSYRWRYEDGQYSPYAPFTQAAFLPESRVRAANAMATPPIEARTAADVEEANYTEGFNTTMFNNVGSITLRDIPRGTPDVVEIDLLYTESISSTIYVLETIEIPMEQRGVDYRLTRNYINETQAGSTTGPPRDEDYIIRPLEYTIETRKIFRGLPNDQLARDFDNVPRRAKAQEITANRLIYGNYLHRYNQPSSIGLNITSIDADSFPYLQGAYDETGTVFTPTYPEYAGTAPDQDVISMLEVSSREDGLHVKGNRSYEVGVAYIDSFGRIGGMLQAGSTINNDGSVSVAQAFRTPFYQDARQQLVAQITTDPPSWADSYRYYIKDVSMDHHSLISYNIYNDGDAAADDSEFIWIEFQSTDRNKVFDERSAGDGNTATVLTLRRENDTVQQTKQRFLVQEIQNEAPDDVRRQLEQTLTNTSLAPRGTIESSYYDTNDDSGGPARPTTGDMYWYWEWPRSGSGLFQVAFEIFNRIINQNQGAEVQPTLSVNEQHAVTNWASIDSSSETTVVDLTQLEAPVYMKITSNRGRGSVLGGADRLVQITQLVGYNRQGDTNTDGLRIEFGANFDMNDDGQISEIDGVTGFPGNLGTQDARVELFTSSVSEEAQERLQGRFWVRTARNGLITAQSAFTFDGELQELQQFWFETEPAVADSNLDLFWETSQTFCVCTDHGWPNKLNWANCVAEVSSEGVYLESTRINDKFNTPQLVRGVRANLPSERFAEERRAQGLIFSGLYNSNTGVNNLNEFNVSEGITKELEPNYGTLQKLHTRDTNVIAFTEDKCFRILADKDLLYNANGGGNVSASSQVLGQTTPFVGEYGISTNPESFASYGHNIYFTDRKRGVVCQLTPGNGQIFEISGRGMNDFFRDRLRTTDKAVGMFDDYTDKYVLSIQGYDPMDAAIDEDDAIVGETMDTTIGYELDVEGWPSRYSFIPDMGLTLNNRFYTWKNGQLWRHNSDTTPRNNFYGEQFDSHVQIIFNDNPSTVKEFLTIGYEGTAGWTVTQIDTESQDTALTSNWPFIPKEGKYFSPIVSTENVYGFEDAGMGSVTADDGQTVYITGTKDKSGIKGFYNVITLTNDSTDKAELFAINTENFISSN